MSDQDNNNIFGGKPDPAVNTENQNNSSNDPLADLLSSIKNEKGEQKYKSVADALVGLQNAQNFIQTLRTEKEQLASELNQVKPVADKVVQLENTVQELLNKGVQSANTPAGLTEEQIAQQVERTLTQREQKIIATNNTQFVVDTLKEAFGNEAETTFYSRAEELGLSKAEINQLAARTPKAVLKMLGIEDKQAPRKGTPVNTSTVNTAGLEPNKQTNIGRNTKRVTVGATTHELHEESLRARQMVEELHSKGMSIDDLTKPSVYFKTFR